MPSSVDPRTAFRIRPGAPSGVAEVLQSPSHLVGAQHQHTGCSFLLCQHCDLLTVEPGKEAVQLLQERCICSLFWADVVASCDGRGTLACTWGVRSVKVLLYAQTWLLCRLPGLLCEKQHHSQQINPSYIHQWFVVGRLIYCFGGGLLTQLAVLSSSLVE